MPEGIYKPIHESDVTALQVTILNAIFQALQREQRIEGFLLRLKDVLGSLAPLDRLNLVVPDWGWRYRVEDGQAVVFDLTRSFSQPNHSADAWVFESQHPLMRSDLREQSRFVHDGARIESGLVADLAVPLNLNDRPFGVLVLLSRSAACFSEAHLRLIQGIADAIAVCVQEFVLRQEANDLREIADALQRTLELEQVLEMILSHIQLQGYDRVRVYLYDVANEVLTGAAQVGSEQMEDFKALRLPVSEDPFSQETLSGRTARIFRRESRDNAPFEQLGSILQHPFRHEWAELPLFIIEDDTPHVVGKISLDNTPSGRPLVQARIDRLMTYAAQAANAIRQAQLYGQMSERVDRRTAALVQANRQLEARDRLLTAFHEIGRTILASFGLEDLLDTLTMQIVSAGIFRSLTVALIDEKAQEVAVVRDLVRSTSGELVPGSSRRLGKVEQRYALDDANIMAHVARTGQMTVIGGWDDRFDAEVTTPESRRGRVAYFIPIKKEDRVLAVLATGSQAEDQADVLHRIETMQPLLDQMAIALDHARVYADLARREAELSNRIQRRDALLEFNRAVQTLKYPSELDHVVKVCMATVARSGLDTQAMAIHRVINADTKEVETYRIGFKGLIFSGIRRGATRLVTLWREKRTLYEDDIEIHAPEEIDQFRDKFGGLAVRSYINVPFSMGILSAHSASPRAYSEIDIDFLQEVGEIFSVGITRLEDLRNLENQYLALEESESRYRNLIRLAKGVAYTCDWTTRRYVYVDESIRDLTGYLPAEFTRDLFQSLIEEEHILLRDHAMPSHLQMAHWDHRPSIFQAEYRLKTRRGDVIWVADHAIEFRDENQKLIRSMGMLQDITERRMLEDRLRQSQKMEAVGQLAGGVAHDFNNLLTGILGMTSLRLSDMAPDHPMRGDLEEIQRAGERAASLTRQLLAFSRKQVLLPKLLDLNNLLIDTQKMLRRLIQEDIDLVVSLGTSACTVKADPGQLEQVVMNLVVNARDAMRDGGPLTIETDRVVIDAQQAHVFGDLAPGDYVSMTVHDTGMGMDMETQAHIFEPFFTTKAPGEGTGMGLAMVYGIVKQSEGHIEVNSAPGIGTRFTVYLPWVDIPVESVESPSAKIKMPRGDETILLVEDEDMVRQLAHRVLTGLGYRVVEAQNGVEALSLGDTLTEPIDLVIADVVMPLMGGKELVDHLLARDPDLAVLFISGHSDEMVTRLGELTPGTAFLQKPFMASALAQSVRDVLDG